MLVFRKKIDIKKNKERMSINFKKPLTFSTTLLLLFFIQQNLIGQVTSYYLPGTAITSFEDINDSRGKDNISGWVADHGGHAIAKEWVPKDEFYAVYKIYVLELWFGCDSSTKQTEISKRLNSVKNKLPISEDLRKDIEIHLIKPGPPITKSEKSLAKVGQEFENMTFSSQEQKLMNELRKKYSKKGEIKFDGEKVDFKASKIGEESGTAEIGNGKKGWIPVSKAFSRWFATLVEMVLEHFKLTELAKKIVTLAYMIAPDLVDGLASKLAELQRELTNPFNSVLDEVSKVAELAWKIYKDLKSLHKLVTDGNFKKVLEQTSIADAVNKIDKHAKKYGVNLKEKLPDKYRKFEKYLDCIGLTGTNEESDDCFKDQFVKDFSDAAANRIPALKKYNVTGSDINDIISGKKTLAEVGLEKGKELVCKSLPSNKYEDACVDVLNKDYKNAALKIAQAEIGSVYGLTWEELNILFKAIQIGEYIVAVKIIGEKVLDKHVNSPCLMPYIKKNIENIVADEEKSNDKALEALEMILCTIYGHQKAREIMNQGQSVYKDFSEMRAKKQVSNTQQISEEASGALIDRRLPEEVISGIVDSLEKSSLNIKDENGNSIAESEVDTLKKQRKEVKEGTIVTFSDEEGVEFKENSYDKKWASWQRELTRRRSIDGDLRIANPGGNFEFNSRADKRFYSINGIQTTMEGAYDNGKFLANKLKKPVFVVYSKSPLNDKVKVEDAYGLNTYFEFFLDEIRIKYKKAKSRTVGLGESFLWDFKKAFIDFNINRELSDAGETLLEGVEIDLNLGNEVTIIAHSRGAAITFNVIKELEKKFSREELKRLSVITLGGYCPREFQWSKYITYKRHVNKYDFIPDLYHFLEERQKIEKLKEILGKGKSDEEFIKDHLFKSYEDRF